MRQCIAFAVAAGVMLMTAGAFAACQVAPTQPAKAKQGVKPPKPDPHCIDLTGLPQISEHIVTREPGPAPVKAPGADFEPTASSNSPTATNSLSFGGLAVGLTKPDPGVRPVPTVGYHWTLD